MIGSRITDACKTCGYTRNTCKTCGYTRNTCITCIPAHAIPLKRHVIRTWVSRITCYPPRNTSVHGHAIIKDYEDVHGCSSGKSEMKSPAASSTKSPGKKDVEELEVDCRKCGGKKKATASKCKEPCVGGRMPDSSEMQPKEAKKMIFLLST